MRPYRILASDDEQIVLDSFAWIIKHFFPDRLELHTARNGLEAIRLAALIKPDIFLMDIMMPGLNGIETIRALRDTETRAIFIILSAYDDFEHARNAVSLGVFEYLLKPAEKNRIIEVLETAIVRLKERDTRAERQIMIQDRIEKLEPAMDLSFIHAVMDFPAHPENLEYLLPIFLDSGTTGFFLSLSLNSASASQEPIPPSADCLNLVRDQSKNLVACLVGPWILNRISIFCQSSDRRIPDILANRLSTALSCHCRIGLGSLAGEPAEIHRSYQESLLALISGSDQKIVCRFDELPDPPRQGLGTKTPLEQEFYAWIQQGRNLEAGLSFDKLVQDLQSTLQDNHKAIRRNLMEIMVVARNAARDNRGSPDRTDNTPIMEGFDTDLPFKVWVGRCREMIDRFCVEQALIRSAKPTDLVSRARVFIENSYEREIGVEEIASHVGVSSGHLSHLFKEDTGTTVLDYLTDWRLKQARALLKQARISVKQVAGRVGYRDPNYFSRIFRQRTGMTVSDFRQSVVEC